MAVQKDINEALINDVLMIYASAEDKMLKAVAKRVAKGIKEEGWNENKLKEVHALHKEIEKILADTKKLSDTKVEKGIIDAYKTGVQEVDGEKGTHKTVLDELDVPMNLKMQVLATNNLLSNASFQVLRKADDAYQKVMAHATTGLLAGVDTRRQASQKMLNEFAAKGITSFVDKAGRNWDLASYAEMAARTVSHNAARQGHFDRQLEVGEDLVKVSTIGTTCPICQRWQGVVLSISGNHPVYHSVEEAKASGLFHPNCKHTFNMYIEELDEGSEFQGKVEPGDYNEATPSSQLYYETQRQRANERKIRYWKKRRALAITPEEELKANENIKRWQYKNLIHCEKHGLRRNYAREGVMVGNATGPQGPLTGGSLKEYEEVFRGVVGDEPRKLFMKLNLKFFSEKKSYTKWLRDEIVSLDEIDVDRAMMKDASMKTVTPTSLYKKYIGDTPGEDYAAVSEYEKGTKEYKSGYAKWLKKQIEEIGVSYKVKPKYVEVHEDIPDEDRSLSATDIYKKYHDGEKPTEAYKKLGGEEGTGMKYGKWVETKKKELLRDGITKTVPFESVPRDKMSKVISSASETIKKAKSLVDDPEVKSFKEEISKITDAKRMSREMREMSEKISRSSGRDKELLEKKYEVLKEHDLELLRKKAATSKVSDADYEMKWLKEHVLDKPGMDEEVKAHVKKKYDIWDERKKEIKREEKEKKEAEERRLREEARKKRIVDDIKFRLEKATNEEVKAFKGLIKDDDPDAELKRKTFDDVLKERQEQADARKRAAEEAERRKKAAEERKRILEERGMLPRDPGASVLDGLSDHYKASRSKKSKVKSMCESIGDSFGYSGDEVKSMIEEDLAKIFDECEYGARMKRSVLKKVLSDDPDEAGFKNLFEVGTGGGCTNQPARARGENSVFGYKGDAEDYHQSKLDRPFYGMVMPRYSDKSDRYYKSGPGRWYGDGITLIFDKVLTENVSFTIGDSLDYDDRVVACEASNPELRGTHYSFESNYKEILHKRARGNTLPNDPNYVLEQIADSSDHYLELQYHGHQTKQDMVNYISHVYIEGHDKDIEELLDRKGIPYTII